MEAVRLGSYAELLKKIQRKEAVVSVVGLGYIGLPTALFYKKEGFSIMGIDTNEELVSELREGKIRVREEGLEEWAKEYLSEITVDSSYDNLSQIDVFILCLPSPIDESGKPVTQFLENSLSDIATRVTKECLMLVESTVPVGTTDRLAEYFEEKSGKKLDEDFWFAHCPERVLLGSIVQEMNTNHRLVGGVTEKSTSLAVSFLSTVFSSELIHPTSAMVSETAKLAENAFRDVGIAYANELAQICTELSIDVTEVIALANLHPRVNILNPGLGVGGYCLPKDGWILVESAPVQDNDGVLIQAAREINDSMPAHVSRRIRDVVLDLALKPTVGLLGVSFKPNVSDTRNSPSLELMKLLGATGMEVIVYDPLVHQEFGDRTAGSLSEILNSCDVVVLGAAHDVLVEELGQGDLRRTVLVDPAGKVPYLSEKVRRYVGLSL
ncbi:MAG: nucleotide sugar dehydrogenase [Candidatus Thorarchaeota archaeon]